MTSKKAKPSSTKIKDDEFENDIEKEKSKKSLKINDDDDDDDDLDDEDEDDDLGEDELDDEDIVAAFDEDEDDDKIKKRLNPDDDDDDELEDELDDENTVVNLSDEDRLKNEIRELADKITDEVIHLQENYDIEEIRKVIQDIDFFNTNHSDECMEKFCENLQTTMGHCRYHYIKNWKKLKKKRAILKEGKLQEYIEELVTKYPTKYIEAIMMDIQGEKQFFNVLKDLNIDSHFNIDDPDSDLDSEDDIQVDARSLTGSRLHYDDDEII